jgi:hypothetical protein
LNPGDDQCEIVNRRGSSGKLAELHSNTLVNLRCRPREHIYDCFAEATFAEFFSRRILSFRHSVCIGDDNISVTEYNLSRLVLTSRHRAERKSSVIEYLYSGVRQRTASKEKRRIVPRIYVIKRPSDSIDDSKE